MTKSRKVDILALFLAAALLAAGCGPGSSNSNATNSNTPQSNSNATKTNVEELGMLVNVPYESDECSFREFPAQKKIVAVLRFSESESNRLIADAEKVRPPQQVQINPESWFPPELIAQGDMSGESMLKGRSYAANAFYQEPYNDGRIIKIEDSDYFVLELTAK